jgi:hypothetical protein
MRSLKPYPLLVCVYHDKIGASSLPRTSNKGPCLQVKPQVRRSLNWRRGSGSSAGM